MVENAKKLDRPGLCLDNAIWKNTNSESINHVLKQATSWRSLKLVDLIQRLCIVVESQFREVQRAICGMGSFVLVNEYKKFGVPRDVRFNKDNEQKARRMRKYELCIKKTLLRSTNSQKVAVAPKHKVKKPGQRKWKLTKKTVSVPVARFKYFA
ncbi:hypothetical protein ElyMa_000098700 [Elysia marginata]|uniref:Uncharacterized protein n=1 Tax=Elysia marginata TaxID=1093978 RepID=A0AAV4EKF2_9GAST|nr:hypothetical protein ElyMa_000098700 [Elysia marginata]